MNLAMIDYTAMRRRTVTLAQQLGYPINEALPLLNESAVIRSCNEVLDRLLSMYCAAACAYGFDSQKAMDWLARETTTNMLTESELQFLRLKAGDCRKFMIQIEG